MAPNMTPTFGRRSYGPASTMRGNSTDIEDEDGDSRDVNVEFRNRTKHILQYVVERKHGAKVCNDRCGETMFRLTQEMRSNHASFFNGLCRKLSMDSSGVSDTFSSVANGIFESGFNFGRLVSLFSWSIYVLELCEEQDDVDFVYSRTADCLEAHRNEFLRLGGWDGFIEFFKDSKDTVWKGLLFTTFSLGALAALMYAKS